jgi:anaerobic magnesium-protoporphyrin IX monomethyl ester cyclase
MDCKILLLEHPRPSSTAHFNDVANTPLSSGLLSGYIAALLAARGVSVRLYEAFLDGSFQDCSAELARLEFDVLGVNAVYLWEHTDELFEFLKDLKARRQNILLILYGFFPTFSFYEILSRYSFVDCVIRGEPEQTFADIAVSLNRDRRADFPNIAGLAWREDGQVRISGARALIEPLDCLLFPLRSDRFLQTVGGNILASRGCYGQCSFCYINNFYGSGCGWRGRSPENVAQEIAELYPRLAAPAIYFVDANFFGSGSPGRKRALDIIERVRQWRDLAFGIECRSNDLDEELVERMAQAGLRQVFLGIESASKASLTRMNKGVRPDTQAAAIRMLKARGVEINPGFIMFEPDAALEDLRANFDFLKANGLLDRLSCTVNVLYHREIALRGTDRFKQLQTENRLQTIGPLDYEGSYGFLHEPVSFLADLMESVCRGILQKMDNSGSPIFWGRESSVAACRLNDFLVHLFEDTLRRLELQDLPLTPAERMRREEEASSVVDGLIVSERVCQL